MVTKEITRVLYDPNNFSQLEENLSSRYIYTLGKKGCYTPIEDNKTNVDRTFVFPLGWNWHDMDPWLFPNEIRHYLGQTFNARSSGIVELRNHSIGGRSPKSIFTLWQLWINICIFFQKFFWLFEQCPVQPLWLLGTCEVFALAREGIKQGAIAARVGLTRATVNRILKRHAATGSLVPGKSSGAPWKTTPRQDRALLRMVRQDRFLSARALTARMRNLYGMRAGRTTVNNRLLSRGYRAYRPTTKPLLTANHRRRLEWAQRWRNLTVMESHLGFCSAFPDIGNYFPNSRYREIIPDIGKSFPDIGNSNFGYREIWNYFLISGIQFPDIRK